MIEAVHRNCSEISFICTIFYVAASSEIGFYLLILSHHSRKKVSRLSVAKKKNYKVQICIHVQFFKELSLKIPVTQLFTFFRSTSRSECSSSICLEIVHIWKETFFSLPLLDRSCRRRKRRGRRTWSSRACIYTIRYSRSPDMSFE